MLHRIAAFLLLFCLGCSCTDEISASIVPDTDAPLSVPAANISNSAWCTDVLNPMMDYLLRSSLFRSIILSEPIQADQFSTMGLKISSVQASGMERLERHGNLYAIVRSGDTLVLQGAIRAVEVSTSFLAKFSFFKPDSIRLVVRGTVVRFSLYAKLQSGQRATLMSLHVTDLGRVEVVSDGRLSSMIRKAASSRLARSRIAKKIGALIKALVREQLKEYPMV